ncbi:MAG: YacP-like NYN domain protein [Actinobacteria bacterium ADurb.Bin346]|nr:MAG: YacP-like NYN domain protein [Actinobacteria bacterium ADurb.Bin346]
MKDLYIIDGYNFIFNHKKPAKLSSSRLTELRNTLIENLLQFKSYISCDIITVFDARNSENLARNSEISDGIQVIYSKKGETADSIVENIVHSNENYDRIFVVTSDNLQQKVVFRHNIYRKSIREFSLEMKESRKKISDRLKYQKAFSEKSFYSIEKRIGRDLKEGLENIRQGK